MIFRLPPISFGLDNYMAYLRIELHINLVDARNGSIRLEWGGQIGDGVDGERRNVESYLMVRGFAVLGFEAD